MKDEEKQIFTIVEIKGFDCEGETVTPLGSRYCTEDKIKEEIDYLNKNINEVNHDSLSWLYFDYQKVELLPEKTFNDQFTYSTDDKKLYLQGLKNVIIHDFDRTYSVYLCEKERMPEKPFRQAFGADFTKFLNDNFFYQDMINMIKKCSAEGLIKSDASKIDFYENDPTLEEKLSTKFKMKR